MLRHGRHRRTQGKQLEAESPRKFMCRVLTTPPRDRKPKALWCSELLFVSATKLAVLVVDGCRCHVSAAVLSQQLLPPQICVHASLLWQLQSARASTYACFVVCGAPTVLLGKHEAHMGGGGGHTAAQPQLGTAQVSATHFMPAMCAVARATRKTIMGRSFLPPAPNI